MPPDFSDNDLAEDRERMVTEQLARRGIRTQAILDAMGWIPREVFLDENATGSAYEDGAQPIDCGQTISQPYMVARMTELLELRASERVLEIGTGSGYQTALLAALARHVYTVEWHLKLLNQAADRLRTLGIGNVSFRCGDGSLGWPAQAPYDAIIVTAGAPDVPPPLRDQLAMGGRLVIPTGEMGDQTLLLVRHTADGFEQSEILKCRFVKLLGAAGWRA